MDVPSSQALVRALKPGHCPRLVKMDQEIGGRNRRAWYEGKVRRALAEADVTISLGAEIDGHLVGALLGSVHYGEFGQPEPVAILDTVLVDREYGRRDRDAEAAPSRPRGAPHRAGPHRGRVGRDRPGGVLREARVRTCAAGRSRASGEGPAIVFRAGGSPSISARSGPRCERPVLPCKAASSAERGGAAIARRDPTERAARANSNASFSLALPPELANFVCESCAPNRAGAFPLEDRR